MNKTHDVILGKTWFTAHDPVINWRKHHVSFKNSDIPPDAVLKPVIISSSEFLRSLKQSNYEEVYRIKVFKFPIRSGREKPSYSHYSICFKMFSRQHYQMHYLSIVLWSSRLKCSLGLYKEPSVIPSFTSGTKGLTEVRR